MFLVIAQNTSCFRDVTVDSDPQELMNPLILSMATYWDLLRGGKKKPTLWEYNKVLKGPRVTITEIRPRTRRENARQNELLQQPKMANYVGRETSHQE